jgi:HTH-type transcriptional regulator / antitoxin HigA
MRDGKLEPPGYEIKQKMEEKGWQQQELADILDLSLKHVNGILNGKRHLTYDICVSLSQIFGGTASDWILKDTEFRSQKEGVKNSSVQIKKNIYEHMPILEMQKRGWIRNTKKTEELIPEIEKFWGISNLDFTFLEEKQSIAFHKGNLPKFNHYFTLTWIHKAKMESKKKKIKEFDVSLFEKSLDQIPEVLKDLSRLNHFLESIEKSGVVFLVLPHLKQTHIDGASFYNGRNPVIVLTQRYNRIDHFLFYLFHEIGHVHLHFSFLKSGEDCIDSEIEGEIENQRENEANLFARSQLKAEEILLQASKFIYLSDAEISRISDKVNVPIASVKGILAKEGKINYSRIHSGNQELSKYLGDKWRVE